MKTWHVYAKKSIISKRTDFCEPHQYIMALFTIKGGQLCQSLSSMKFLPVTTLNLTNVLAVSRLAMTIYLIWNSLMDSAAENAITQNTGSVHIYCRASSCCRGWYDPWHLLPKRVVSVFSFKYICLWCESRTWFVSGQDRSQELKLFALAKTAYTLPLGGTGT